MRYQIAKSVMKNSLHKPFIFMTFIHYLFYLGSSIRVFPYLYKDRFFEINSFDKFG